MVSQKTVSHARSNKISFKWTRVWIKEVLIYFYKKFLLFNCSWYPMQFVKDWLQMLRQNYYKLVPFLSAQHIYVNYLSTLNPQLKQNKGLFAHCKKCEWILNMLKRNVTTLVLLTVYYFSLCINWAFLFILKKSHQCYLIFNHFIHQNHQVPVVGFQEIWHFAFYSEVGNIKKLCVLYRKELDNLFFFFFQLPLFVKSVREINKLLKHPVSSVFVIQDKVKGKIIVFLSTTHLNKMKN